MNIFVLDANPITAARFHNDRHCVKMILESCQLMATAHYILDTKPPPANVDIRPTHMNHPCAVWVRGNTFAYDWLHTLCGGLLMEFRARYGHAHSYESKWEALWGAPTLASVAPMPAHPLCMPDHCKVLQQRDGGRARVYDPVASYRRYYNLEKQHLAKWYGGDETKIPDWFKVKHDECV